MPFTRISNIYTPPFYLIKAILETCHVIHVLITLSFRPTLLSQAFYDLSLHLNLEQHVSVQDLKATFEHLGTKYQVTASKLLSFLVGQSLTFQIYPIPHFPHSNIFVCSLITFCDDLGSWMMC